MDFNERAPFVLEAREQSDAVAAAAATAAADLADWNEQHPLPKGKDKEKGKKRKPPAVREPLADDTDDG